MTDPSFTEREQGERQALLEVRSFILKHGTKEVDAYCAQRLHDIRMDAAHCAQQGLPTMPTFHVPEPVPGELIVEWHARIGVEFQRWVNEALAPILSAGRPEAA